MHPASIAAATWTYGTRTLATGTPVAPTNRQERIAEAVWQYVTRTLQSGPISPAGRVRGEPSVAPTVVGIACVGDFLMEPVGEIYLNADNNVKFFGAASDSTGVPLNAGTCSYTLYGATGAWRPGTPVPGGTGVCSYINGSNGDYLGAIPAAVTSDSQMTAGLPYVVVIVFDDGTHHAERTLRLRAGYEGEN